MASVITFRLKHGKEAHFNYLIKKFHETIGKSNWPARYEWYQLINGGAHPTYVLVIPRANWAAFKPLEPSFDAMLEQALGRHEAEQLLESFSKTLQHQESEIIKLRPDLSYTPSK